MNHLWYNNSETGTFFRAQITIENSGCMFRQTSLMYIVFRVFARGCVSSDWRVNRGGRPARQWNGWSRQGTRAFGSQIYMYFHWIDPLGWFSHRVSMSVCLCVCLSVCSSHYKTPTSGDRGDLWSKNVFLILTCDDKIFKKGYVFFFHADYENMSWYYFIY